ncbi:hypothetical protein CYMTET_31024 [Cymbomonas tetramitiformis]|uniref:EF-hand domain-containing protein n=1 Tax=Cymbomonas tetramitiformis TaxID=36881 RepID=A0AAE0FI24_9CHLO|nr:hypothetical protein CYMTET_31024 [Cymbomonas tetramitiformis]
MVQEWDARWGDEMSSAENGNFGSAAPNVGSSSPAGSEHVSRTSIPRAWAVPVNAERAFSGERAEGCAGPHDHRTAHSDSFRDTGTRRKATSALNLDPLSSRTQVDSNSEPIPTASAAAPLTSAAIAEPSSQQRPEWSLRLAVRRLLHKGRCRLLRWLAGIHGELSRAGAKSAFAQMDSENRGFLSRSDLFRGLREFESEMKPEMYRQYIDCNFLYADTDRDGKLFFKDFCLIYNTKAQARLKFQQYDADKDGFITKADFARIIQQLHMQLDEKMFQSYVDMNFRFADRDFRGAVSFGQFLACYATFLVSLSKLKTFKNVDVLAGACATKHAPPAVAHPLGDRSFALRKVKQKQKRQPDAQETDATEHLQDEADVLYIEDDEDLLQSSEQGFRNPAGARARSEEEHAGLQPQCVDVQAYHEHIEELSPRESLQMSQQSLKDLEAFYSEADRESQSKQVDVLYIEDVEDF